MGTCPAMRAPCKAATKRCAASSFEYCSSAFLAMASNRTESKWGFHKREYFGADRLNQSAIFLANISRLIINGILLHTRIGSLQVIKHRKALRYAVAMGERRNKELGPALGWI